MKADYWLKTNSRELKHMPKSIKVESSIVVAGEWSSEITDPEFQIVLKYWEGLTPRRILTPEEVELLIGRSLRSES